MRRYVTLLALAAVLLPAIRVLAAPDVSVAVLGLEPVDMPEPLAQQLTDALRQRAATTSGVRVVPGKDLIELKMVFGCDGELPACMANAGKVLGADKLLYGTIKKGPSKANVTVTLKLLDVKTAVVERFVNDTVSRRELAGSNIAGTAGKWFAQLLEIEAKPTLTVTSDPSGASVAVDGTAAGRTPVTLRDLSPGAHTVVLSMAGRQSVTRTVELRAGSSQEVTAALETVAPPVAHHHAEPPPPEPLVRATPLPPPTTTEHPGRTAKILGGALFGAGVLAGVVAIVTWSRYDRRFDGSYEQKVNQDLQGFGGLANDMEAAFLKNPSGCSIPSTLAAKNPALASKYHSDCTSGNTFADATTGMWITAGALAAGGIISFVIGDRQAAKAKERKTLGIMRQSLRVAPVFSSQGGGVTAAFEF
jgi:hypothetical protein